MALDPRPESRRIAVDAARVPGASRSNTDPLVHETGRRIAATIADRRAEMALRS
jgi:hypothetical protein